MSTLQPPPNNPDVDHARVVIVGASGMVGGYALRYAIEHPAVGSVTSIGRKNLGMKHAKLKEILHADFADCSTLVDVLTGQDAAVFCLGAYTGKVSDSDFRTITVDYPIEFARVLRAGSPCVAFSFLRGNGADPTGRSRIPFARYKGQAETALLSAGFPHVYIFRPAYINPWSLGRNRISAIACCGPYPVFRLVFPNQVIRADDLARAMVNVAVQKTDDHRSLVFENREIRAMVESLRTKRM